jgi:hypothetical protein
MWHKKLSSVSKLSSPYFLFAILILLVNDFLLKAKYGNWLTGKISDFAGLYAFTLFFIALWPKYKRLVVSLVCLTFLYWKSSYSDQIIVFFKTFGIPFNRTSDLTDLIALPLVFIAAAHFNKLQIRQVSIFGRSILISVSCFAFMATSYVRPLTPEQSNAIEEISQVWPREITKFTFNDAPFLISESKKSFQERLKNNKDFNFSSHWPIVPIFLVPFFENDYSYTYSEYSVCRPQVKIYNDYYNYSKEQELAKISNFPVLLRAEFNLKEQGGNVLLNLKMIEICNFKEERKLGKQEVLKEFEREVVNPER